MDVIDNNEQNRQNEVTHDLERPDSEIELTNEQMFAVVKPFAIDFAEKAGAPPWLMRSLRTAQHMEELVSDLRHLRGGQEYILTKLQTVKPDLLWYRGGTFKTLRDNVSEANAVFFTEDELNTPIIDGGANGAFNRPDLAKGFLKLTPRKKPVIYTLTIGDLLNGIKDNAISLVAEHEYDLCVHKGADTKEFVQFLKEHLHVTQIDPETLKDNPK